MIAGTNGVEQCLLTHKKYWEEHHLRRVEDKLIEEASELIQAIQKRRWGEPGGTNARVVEELADLVLCLDFLARDVYKNRDELLHAVTERAVKLDHLLSTELWKRTHE